jgi:hypothetical protein
VSGAAATPRVDVEAVVLCDVLPDGTAAATVLVEPVYDTSSGDRVGTRTVDPATGAPYTVQGTLQPCGAPSDCPDCQTVILCDTATVPTSTAPVTATGYQVPAGQQISGQPRNGSDADAEAIWSGQTVSVPGAAPGAADGGAHTHYGVILGLGDAACGDLDPAGTVDLTATVTYRNDGPGGAWDWYGRLSMWDGATLLPGVDNFGQGSGAFFPAGSTRTATITNTVPVASLLAGTVTVEFDLETGADGTDTNPKTWTVTGGAVTAGPVPVTGCTGQAVPFMRHICRDCDGTPTITDTDLDGTTAYTVTGTVGACGTSSPDDPPPLVLGHVCYDDGTGTVRQAAAVRCAGCDDSAITYVDVETGQDVTAPVLVPCPADPGCASPTTPTTSVGLCLADGTPIAVTIVRDCTGTVTSEGWLNLVTGAWTAGAVPTGTVACGESRSISLAGTFCDIDTAGDVVGLVLVEYHYDDTGAIASVRLVDAVTGTTYTPTGTVTTCPAGVEQPEQDALILCDVQADGTSVPLVRDYRRDETGAIVAHSDYALDGTAYTPTGTVQQCAPDVPVDVETIPLCVLSATGAVLQQVRREVLYDSAGAVVGSRLVDSVTGNPVTVPAGATVAVCPGCRDCETLVLCDMPTAAPVTITGTAASGTLSNGVGWTSTGATNTTAMAANLSNADGSWWGLHSFPHSVTAPTKWTFSRPSIAEFSVYVRYYAPDPTISRAQLPAGLEVVSLPDGYTYDETTGVLTRTSDDAPTDPCSYVTDPRIASSARFRTAGPVTSFTTAPALNSRIATCGVFFTYWAGAVSVVPAGPFLRHICRSCDGTPTVTDTLLDGTTPYTVAGTAGVCEPPEPESCCQPVQVCIQQDPTQSVEFISNERHLNNSSVDPVWKWTPDLSAANPPWYDMYEYQYSGAWSVTDTDTARPAWWVSPHPTGGIQQSSPALPNEGPTLTAQHWYPRAYFDLPDNADPATIQIQATVFNADQIGRAFRLNNGAWQTLPATATHNGTPYTFGPATVPGAQAGRNFLYLDVEETVGGGAGLMVHLKVTYEVIPETRSWTRMVCCDDSVYYLDEDGQRQDAVPDGWHVAPCSGSTAEGTGVETVLLCDVTEVTTPGETPERITNGHFAADTSGWTISGGAAYVPTGGPDGQVGVLDFSQNNQAAGKVEQATTVTPGLTYNLSARIGIWSTGGTTPQRVLVEVLDGSGAILHSQTVAPVEVSGGPQWPADGVVGPVPIVATDTTMLVRFTDQVGGDFIDALLDDVSLLGPGVPPASEGQAVPFLRHYTIDPATGTATYFDTTLDGDTYAPVGEVTSCNGGSGDNTSDCAKQVIERCGCDDTDGDGIGDVQYTELWAVDPCGGAAPELLGTFLDGDLTQPYTPVAPVECTAAETLPGPLSTGVRAVTGTAAQDIAAAFPGLQSVSLTVLAGTVNATMTDGAAVPIPAGVTMTWSVAQDSDTALAAASFAGTAAGASYLLNWTRK